MVAVLQEMRRANRVRFRASDVPAGDIPGREKVLARAPFSTVMERHYGPELEAISCTAPYIVRDVDSQPLLAAAHIAFSYHLPLVLTPDVIWATLLKGAAIHINLHSEQLRSNFVDHEGKEKIRVVRNDIALGDPNLPWPEIIGEFADRIKQKAPAAAELFDAGFSTTGLAERTAYRVALMDSMQNYVGYELATLCGIPEVCLEGETEDWQIISDRISGFREIGLGEWVDALGPICAEFVAASKGAADSGHWDNIYKFHPPTGSGSDETTGWIRDLFPYLAPDAWSDDGNYRVNPFVGKSTKRGPVINAFPSRPALAPFVWQYLDQTIDMELAAGLVGVSFQPDTLEIKPEFGWVVRRQSSYEQEQVFGYI